MTSTETLGDIIVFNMLSEVYGNAAFRRLFGASFGLCYPLLQKFYHSMLSHAPLREYMFSDLHTPAVYFIPPVHQKEELFKYASEDATDSPPPQPRTVDSLTEEERKCYSEVRSSVQDYTTPLVQVTIAIH